jgi:hypothetical protein
VRCELLASTGGGVRVNQRGKSRQPKVDFGGFTPEFASVAGGAIALGGHWTRTGSSIEDLWLADEQQGRNLELSANLEQNRPHRCHTANVACPRSHTSSQGCTIRRLVTTGRLLHHRRSDLQRLEGSRVRLPRTHCLHVPQVAIGLGVRRDLRRDHRSLTCVQRRGNPSAPHPCAQTGTRT